METEFQVHAIALKTLKQRCEYLQERLNAVEEENCKLKIEKAQDLNKRTFNRTFSVLSGSSSDLEDQIVVLKKEKSQMANQIELLSSENLALWSQLSELLPGKDVSPENFAFSNFTGSQVSKFKPDITSNDLYGDYSKESLEEISLKLINGILMGKNELEKQYSQMIDLQKENNSDIKNVTYIPKQIDKRSVMKNLKDHVQKLKDIKAALYQQKNELSSGISVLKNLEILPRTNVNTRSGDTHYSIENNVNANQSGNEFSNEDSGRGISGGENSSEDLKMICPMCGRNIPGLYQDFYEHVCSYFMEENDDCFDGLL